ncbi:hypothetical protein SAMN04490248_12247 [Salinihabitans flavidus]|uniref:Flp pilus assembly protein, pilin Flp n=1 Tax=Salinihabitans flavidus TaxID=569882 RepID=A0A1H8UV82_9RHOB|nr:hypothetical protein [Salinihabitans flavidus]SEP06903.1 hypothetical protein SAMN04490248_12247 [Salinihabitans flavidus]
MLKRFLTRFHRNERGAVTVDWVVITAGVVALSLAVFALIGTEATELATTTGDTIRDRAN